MKMTLSSVVLVAVVLARASFADQVNELPPLTEKIDVSVTSVDVTVRDSNGKTVGGLGREDFEILEDGELQRITGFYAIENAVVQLKEEAETADRDQFRRKVVLMVDNNTMNRVQRNGAIDLMTQFIDNQFAEDYEWSVVSVGRKVSTVQGFTTEKDAIRSALLSVKKGPTFEYIRELDRDVLTDPSRALLRDNEGASDYNFGTTARFQAREQTLRNIRSTINSAKAVVQTCRAYSSAAGKKLLILVTGGMEVNTQFNLYDTPEDRNMIEMKRELSQLFEVMVREANAANFNIYVINGRGLGHKAPQHDISRGSLGLGGSARNPFFGEGFSATSDVSDRDSSALTISLGTGGRYLPGNDVGDAMEAIDADSANFYSLAYAPQHKDDGKYHKIAVRLKRPGLHVSHRAGYVSLSSEARFERSLRSNLAFPKEKGTLPVTLKLGDPGKKSEGQRRIPVITILPMSRITFIPREENQIGRVHVYLSLYDDDGNNVGVSHRAQDITVTPAQRPNLTRELFRYTMALSMKPGNYTVVVTVRDELSNEIGSAFQDVRL